MDKYRRQLREQNPIDWNSVNKAWIELMNVKINIQFQQFFDEIVNQYLKSPHNFLSHIKKAQTFPAKIPDDFLSLDIMTRSLHFFSYFKFIFNFDKLEKFVCQTNFEPSHFNEHFGKQTDLLFSSITHLYVKMTTSLDQSLFCKYVVKTVRVFSKLLVPDGYRQLTSKNFKLKYIYMSPILYTRDQNTKVPSYCCINEQGDFVILDNSPDNNQLDKFNQTVYTGMMEDEKLLFYKDDNNPVIELIFPTSDNASDAFIFSLTPPEPGFMELISFLHSFQAFKNKKLLNSEFPSQLPKIFKTEIQKCIESSSMELLFYAFSISQKNTKINERNIKFFISALGDKLMPFIRALLHMNWCEEPFGGHIILRHDSPLSSLLRMLLKFYCEDYIKYMMTEIKKIIDESDEFIHEMPISNEEDAMTFIQKVFYREIDTLFDSVDTKMSSLLRSVIRAVFIRTAGFYINQHAPYLTIPNLMLLRYILPPITTTITLSYQSGSKSQAISKLASSSFLSLFYRNGWTSDPFLSKYSKYMEKYYQKSVEFAIHVIDCHDYQFDNPKIYLDDQWDMIDLLSDAADNLIFNDMKSPNKILDTHIYSISIMQMIEEYAYDFSIVPK